MFINTLSWLSELTSHYRNVNNIFSVAEGRPVHYDAFLSVCNKDSSMKEQLTRKLEEKEGLKLFILERDLIPGVSRHYVTAELIFRRCVLTM